MDLDYKKDVSINVDALDVEWTNQASLYARYAEASAEANARLRKLEEKVKVVRSELTLEAAQNPDIIAPAKPTADNIEAYYRTHPRHKAAKEEHDEAAYEAEMLQNAVFAFQQRKVALENLVRLHASSYFAGPLEPRDLSYEQTEYLKERRAEAPKEETRAAVKETLNEPIRRRRNQQEA